MLFKYRLGLRKASLPTQPFTVRENNTVKVDFAQRKIYVQNFVKIALPQNLGFFRKRIPLAPLAHPKSGYLVSPPTVF